MIPKLPIKINISDEFLREEERLDYVISAKMKAVWAVQIDLIERLKEVCSKYGLSYYASGGTLIGAVRHKGYIPWDDDVDVVMFRKDYEKLEEVAAKEFKHPYFFQTIHSDPLHIRGHAQLRNSLTTGYVDGEEDLAINKGIFIDVFILDSVPDDPVKCFFFGLRLRMIWTMLTYKRYSAKEQRIFLSKLIGPLFRDVFFRFVDYRKMYEKYDRLCAKYNGRGSKTVSTITFNQCRNRRGIYDINWFSGAHEAPFEFTKIMIPDGYDGILRRYYGDYMTPRKEPTLHGNVTLDPYHPFTEKENRADND